MYADFHLNLQVWFWPLIHTSGENSSWCYFLKRFRCTGSFSLLLVLLCCLAEITGCWAAAGQKCSEAGPACGQRGAELAPLLRDECPSAFGSAPCWGLLLHCLLMYWHPVYFKGEAHPCKRMGTLLGQTCGTRNHYKSNCIFGWRLPSLTLPFSQNTPHCCTCIFPQGRKGNGEERHLVDITLLVQFPNSERWYPADECSIKTE